MSIFTKIINKEIPAKIVYEDELCIAIEDIAPKAPIHILVIPKKEIRSMDDAKSTDQNLIGHLYLKAGEIAKHKGLSENGYRLVTNVNSHGGQTVFHLHIHILGGRPLGDMG